MHKNSLITNVSSKNVVPDIRDIQISDEQSKEYYNFINSLKTESTRKSYTYCLERFLGHYEKDSGQELPISFDRIWKRKNYHLRMWILLN